MKFTITGPAIQEHPNTLWPTPRWLYAKLLQEFHFVVDAAANRRNHLCDVFMSMTGLYRRTRKGKYKELRHHPEGALGLSWDLGGDVFINPPYGRNLTDRFVRKAHAEFLSGVRTVMLIPAKTETAFWHECVRDAQVRHLRSRVSFGGSGSGWFASAVVIFDPEMTTGSRVLWDLRQWKKNYESDDLTSLGDES